MARTDDDINDFAHQCVWTVGRLDLVRFSVTDHAKATEGLEYRKDKAVIDETPAAYKSIDAVMNAQRDLVDLVHVLPQVVCVKG